MSEISAAAVKSLRDRTNLPMMKCKEALQKTGGDEEKAIEWLRKEGLKFREQRGDRETSSGRLDVYASVEAGVGAMIELLCESDPVAKTDGFRQLAGDLARQLATGRGAQTPEALLAQPSPSRPGATLAEQWNDLQNQIREVFKLNRMLRIEGPCGGYVHHDGAKACLVQIALDSKASAQAKDVARDIAMHIVAARPLVVNIADLDPALVAKEREILSEASRKEGKPENIIPKMVEGRMRNFYAEKVLCEQPFVKDDSQTVGKLARSAGISITRFVSWELGAKEA
jgi:elongation factor Ts